MIIIARSKPINTVLCLTIMTGKMESWQTDIILLLVTNATTWFFSRRKQAAETRNIELTNLLAQFQALSKMAKDNAEELSKTNQKLNVTNQFVADVLGLICGRQGCLTRIKLRIEFDDYGPHLIKLDEDDEIKA